MHFAACAPGALVGRPRPQGDYSVGPLTALSPLPVAHNRVRIPGRRPANASDAHHMLNGMQASAWQHGSLSRRFQVACSCWPSFLLWDAVPPWSIGKTAQMKVGFK